MGCCPSLIFCSLSKDLFSSTGTHWRVWKSWGMSAHLGCTEIPYSCLRHTHLNLNVPVPVWGFITSQMLFQGSWPVTWAWLNLLSSSCTQVWITLPDLNQGNTQDRSSVQRDCWKFLLWATLHHLAVKGSGSGSDLVVNMRHLPEAHWKWGACKSPSTAEATKTIWIASTTDNLHILSEHPISNHSANYATINY